MPAARSFNLGLPVSSLVALFAMIPLWLVDIPPLADYPNHLARVYVLMNMESGGYIADHYRNVLAWQPNLAFDVVVVLLAQAMPVEAAGRIFAALTLLSMVGGVVALNRVLHRRYSLWPLLAFLVVYNRLFLWGFLGYLFTLGLALLSFAAWVALRETSSVKRLALATVLSTLLYLGHLYAFGVYALAVGGYEFMRFLEQYRQPIRRTVLDMVYIGLPFLPSIYLFLFISPTSNAASKTYWGSLWRKLEAPANVFYTYNLKLDIACFAVACALIGLGLVYRRVFVARRMYGVFLLLGLAFLAMPDQLFSSYGADRRIPIAFVLFAIAACDWRPGESRWCQGAAAVIALTFVLKIGLISEVWLRSDRVYAEYLDAIEEITPGSKLMVVVAHPSQSSLPPIPTFEIANMAIIRRQVFVASLFAAPRDAGKPVAFGPDAKTLADMTPSHITLPHTLERLANENFARREGPFREELVERYDYALVVNEDALPSASAIPDTARRIFTGSNFVLVKFTHASG